MSDGSYHTMKEDDCLLKIADERGVWWESIWNHANNAELKQQREQPNVLLPGDKVFIPEKNEGEEALPCDQKHRFRLKGTPALARFRLLEGGEPRKNVSYILHVDDKLVDAKEVEEGVIEARIPPGALKGFLTVRDGEHNEEYEIAFGNMDPVDTESGARKRLTNLGYDCGEEGSDEYTEALKAFQVSRGIEDSGELDEATQEALLDAHGC